MILLLDFYDIFDRLLSDFRHTRIYTHRQTQANTQTNANKTDQTLTLALDNGGADCGPPPQVSEQRGTGKKKRKNKKKKKNASKNKNRRKNKKRKNRKKNEKDTKENEKNRKTHASTNRKKKSGTAPEAVLDPSPSRPLRRGH